MSEKLCLKWNDFQENVNTVFTSLREDREFSDVTLVCEDGHQLEAHKVILVASSAFFLNLLKKSRHPHPLIYMKGVKYRDLQAMIDFLYVGEANIFQENLESFLAIAEELKLKGLSGLQDDSERITEPNQREITTKPTFKRERLIFSQEQIYVASKDEKVETGNLNQERTISVQNFISEDLQELDAKVKTMMVRSQNRISSGTHMAYICKICGKDGHSINIRDHIEANHLEGVSLPCDLCEKTFRSRNAMRKHQCRNKI